MGNNLTLHNLYFSPIIRSIKSRRIRGAEHVTHMGNMKSAYEISVRKTERRDHLGFLNLGERIISKFVKDRV
jgi:hypothetical protein